MDVAAVLRANAEYLRTFSAGEVEDPEPMRLALAAIQQTLADIKDGKN